MSVVTERDVLMMAVPIATAHIANPSNNVSPYDESTNKEILRSAIKAVKGALSEEGVTIADHFQEAVLDAARKSA